MDKLTFSGRASMAEVDNKNTDVLQQMYNEGRSRIEERRLRDGLVPAGAFMITITVEQWCTTEDDS